MADKHFEALRVFGPVICLFGVFALGACKRSIRADQVLYACFDRSGGSGEALSHLREISDRFRYRLSEYGEQAKSDLETIGANPAVIPEGRPIQADVRNEDNDVVAIASNFGNNGEGIRVSFFYSQDESRDLPFRQAVVSSLKAIEGAQVNLSAVEAGANPCAKS